MFQALKRWVKQALCQHHTFACHTTLVGGIGSHVENTATCLNCGAPVLPPTGLWSHDALISLLDRAKQLPDGAREKVL